MYNNVHNISKCNNVWAWDWRVLSASRFFWCGGHRGLPGAGGLWCLPCRGIWARMEPYYYSKLTNDIEALDAN